MLGLHALEGVNGWSILALSGNGGMKGASQIVVRRDDDDEWVAEDMHSHDYITPLIDESQDVQLIFAQQDELTGETAWGVVLPKDSCDESDYHIDDKKRFMLWAYGQTHDFYFHSNNRGQFLANLLAPPPEPVSFDEYDKMALTMPNVPVVRGESGMDPTNPFICSYFDLDVMGKEFGFSSNDKIHMVGYDVDAESGNEKYLHHMVLFECDGELMDEQVTSETRSGLGNSGLFHGKVEGSCTAMPNGCQNPVATWAVGAGANVMPEDVGIALGDGHRWLVLQMHYFNPQLDEGISDSSGLDVYFTKELRPVEGAVMFLNSGAATGQHPPIQGGLEDVTMETLYVEPECSKQWSEPITVMSVHHHSHFMGTRQEIIIERDGKNLGPLRDEMNYDYNHQTGVAPEAHLRVLYPGDRIATTCHFDTTSVAADSMVEIGEESNREMCVPFFYYYPKQEAGAFQSYYPPEAYSKIVISDYTWCSTPPLEEMGSFGSRCAEKLYADVPAFFKQTFEAYGYDGPSFTFSEMCNGGEETKDLREAQPICPKDCSETQSCSANELVAAVKQACQATCGSLGLSLYPDNSRTELFETANTGCPTPLFDPPTLAKPEKCVAKGALPISVTLTEVSDNSNDQEPSLVDDQNKGNDLGETGVVMPDDPTRNSSSRALGVVFSLGMSLMVVLSTVIE